METVFISPGSNLTAVPAGMSRCVPYDRARSKINEGFVSRKG
jgi:hypothetical protein